MNETCIMKEQRDYYTQHMQTAHLKQTSEPYLCITEQPAIDVKATGKETTVIHQDRAGCHSYTGFCQQQSMHIGKGDYEKYEWVLEITPTFDTQTLWNGEKGY